MPTLRAPRHRGRASGCGGACEGRVDTREVIDDVNQAEERCPPGMDSLNRSSPSTSGVLLNLRIVAELPRSSDGSALTTQVWLHVGLAGGPVCEKDQGEAQSRASRSWR